MSTSRMDPEVKSRLMRARRWGAYLHYVDELKTEGYSSAEAKRMSLEKYLPPEDAVLPEEEKKESMSPAALQRSRKRVDTEMEREKVEKEIKSGKKAEKLDMSEPAPSIDDLAGESLFSTDSDSISPLDEYKWVKENAENYSAKMTDAPTLGAWAMLQTYRNDDSYRKSFWATWGKLAEKMATKQLDITPKEYDPRADRPILNALDVQQRLHRAEKEAGKG